MLTFDALLDAAADLPPLAVAIPEATTPTVLEGVQQSVAAGVMEPLLIGERPLITAAWKQLDDAPLPEIATPREDETAAQCAVRLAAEGSVQAVGKGALHTDELMRAVMRGLGRGRRLSHVFLVSLPSYHKLLFVTDAAVNIAPDLEAKAEILVNAVGLAAHLGLQTPKVAVLSSVATVRPRIPSSLDAACLSKMAERGQIEDAIVDGPLAFDNAISREAAERKGIDSPVSGDADILLVPDLDAGNILVKDLVYLADATVAGIVVGARVPVLLTSRADPPRARLISAALASILAQHAALPCGSRVGIGG
jgi:phosphotransacetylase